MFGTGIFVTPTVVLAIVNSKGVALLLWLAGGFITWAGLAMYLEYGIRFPLTGGELHYVRGSASR
jgi:amino acid transporter